MQPAPTTVYPQQEAPTICRGNFGLVASNDQFVLDKQTNSNWIQLTFGVVYRIPEHKNKLSRKSICFTLRADATRNLTILTQDGGSFAEVTAGQVVQWNTSDALLITPSYYNSGGIQSSGGQAMRIVVGEIFYL